LSSWSKTTFISRPSAGLANARSHLNHEARAFSRSPERRDLDRRPRWAVVAKSPLPHRIQGGAVTLEVRSENADADDVADVGSCGTQDGVQVGEKLLGFGLGGVGALPCLRINPEQCGHEDPSIHLDGLWNRPRVHWSFVGFDRSHVGFLPR
jgi:hypothetical protein